MQKIRTAGLLASVILFAILGVYIFSKSKAAPNDFNGYTVDSIVYDMYGAPCRSDGTVKNGQVIGACPWGRHEAMPQRLLSSFDWYEGARPDGDPWPLTNKHVSAWGQVFAAEPGSSEWNARLQVDDHSLWILHGDNVWREVKPDASRTVQGTFWNGAFQTQSATDAEKGIRSEGGPGNGGHSFRLSPMQNKTNYATFHWWWSGYYPRAAVPNDAKGVWQGAKMRLIPDSNPSANLNNAKFIASIGSDRYSSAEHVSDGTAISAMMQPRMKYVTPQWRWFSGSTLSESQLRANPPPPVSRSGGGGGPVLNPAGTTVYDKIKTALNNRQTAPARIVFAGSSTTAGTGASSVAQRYVNKLIAKIQAAYPSGSASEPAVIASATADFETLSTTPAVHGYNAGQGGTKAATYLTDSTRTKVASVKPAIVLHMVGSNDYGSQDDPAGYKSALQASITALKNAIPGDDVHILVHPYKRLDTAATRYQWAQYGKAMQEIASADFNNVLFIDLSDDFEALGTSTGDPLDLISTDNVHLTDKGHTYMADYIFSNLNLVATDVDPPTTSGFTTINDSAIGTGNNQYEYTGNWGVGSGPGRYGGDDHWTNTADASYQIRFEGNQIKLYGVKALNNAIMAVSVNGGPETLVDTYSATRQDQALLFQSQVLTTNQNIVKVRNTGTKNSASTGFYITADRAEVSTTSTNNQPPPPPPNPDPEPDPPVVNGFMTVNDSLTGTAKNRYDYSSGWNIGSGTGQYQGDDHWTNTANATYQIRFDGNQIKLYGVKAFNNGIMAVSLNGGPESLIDTYGQSRQDQALLYQSPILTTQNNIVKVRHTGTKNASAAAGMYITADKAEISTTVASGGNQTPTVSGDVNGDGLVNNADLAVLLANYRKSGTFTRAQGDLTGDGKVNAFDLSRLVSNFRQ